MVVVYAISVPSFVYDHLQRRTLLSPPLYIAQLQQLRYLLANTTTVHSIVGKSVAMLSTLRVLAALGLLLYFVEASQDHGMQSTQI